MRNIIPIFCFIILLGSGITAEAILYSGVDFPNGTASFADVVVEFDKGSNSDVPFDEPLNSLGAPDYDPGYTAGDPVTWVSLGDTVELSGIYASLTLQFTDNYLTTSGNSNKDLWIFERGDEEGVDVEISVNNKDWISVGRHPGGPEGIDIDDFIGSGGVILGEKYYYVKMTDLGLGLSTNPALDKQYAGADIDAVGASGPAPIPEPATILLLGSGLGGLLLSHRKKNRIC